MFKKKRKTSFIVNQKYRKILSINYFLLFYITTQINNRRITKNFLVLLFKFNISCYLRIDRKLKNSDSHCVLNNYIDFHSNKSFYLNYFAVLIMAVCFWIQRGKIKRVPKLVNAYAIIIAETTFYVSNYFFHYLDSEFHAWFIKHKTTITLWWKIKTENTTSQ